MKHAQAKVTGALKYGWMPETNESWLDLKVDDSTTLRLTFSDAFAPTLKLCLQQLQGHASEERRKAGLPQIEQTYMVKVKQLEFGRDDVNQIAVIRTRFENGTSQDTPLEKAQISETIEFLKAALQAFEKLSKSSKH